MPENLLTDTKVRSAKPTDRDWKLSDGGGLFLLVKSAGGKLWQWEYCLQGKENPFAIGGFPEVSLAEARAAREKARRDHVGPLSTQAMAVPRDRASVRSEEHTSELQSLMRISSAV